MALRARRANLPANAAQSDDGCAPTGLAPVLVAARLLRGDEPPAFVRGERETVREVLPEHLPGSSAGAPREQRFDHVWVDGEDAPGAVYDLSLIHI